MYTPDLIVVIFPIFAYLVGSIPTGYWLVKILKGIDIRQLGSGSTGATNVYRNVGPAAGILVFIIDFLKGYLPTYCFLCFPLVRTYLPNGCFGWLVQDTQSNHIFPVVIAAATLIGHSRSIFLNFTGGKSAATGLGTLFALNFTVGASTFVTWMVVLFIGKMVSLASIVATASCIPYMYFFGGPPAYVTYCILGFIYVTYRHKANIKRIMSGTEPKIGKAANKP